MPVYHFLFRSLYTVLALFGSQVPFALKTFSGISAIVPRWDEAAKYYRSKLVAGTLLLVEWAAFVSFWCATHCLTEYLRINAVLVAAIVLCDAYFAYILHSCNVLGSEGRIDIGNNRVLRPGRALRVQPEDQDDGLFVARDVDQAVGYPPDHGKLPPMQVGIPVVDCTQNQIAEHDI